jgi:hypothetical protein
MRALMLGVLLLISCGDDSAVEDLAVAHDLSVPDAASAKCDPIKQDCPMGQKCTLVLGPTFPAPEPTCVPITGSLSENAACTPPGGVDAGMIGADDCQKGLICVPRPSGTTCNKFCKTNADCTTAKQFCGGSGVCAPSCALYGSDCPGGSSCVAYVQDPNGVANLVCSSSGALSLGDACVAGADCGPNLLCAGTPKQCRAVCSTDHPCASGSCMNVNGTMAGQLGYCQ